MAAPSTWFKLGPFDIPMPPSDLYIALCTVLLFLPAVVLGNKILSVVFKSIKEPDSARSKKD
jgi:hypothetical protein